MVRFVLRDLKQPLKEDAGLRSGNADGERRSERAWVIAGAILASVVLITASIEVWRNDGTPNVYGADHLALFAQPMRAKEEVGATRNEREKAPKSSPSIAQSVSALPATIDYEATATITTTDMTAGEAKPLVAIGSPELLYVERGKGVFRTPSGKRTLGLGDIAPGGGTIHSFKRRNGNWVAMVARGQTSR